MTPVECCPLPSDKRLGAQVESARKKYITARTQALALIRTRPLDDIGREDAVWAAIEARRWYWHAVNKRKRVADKRTARKQRPADEIRKVIRLIPGAWVRVFRDGKRWAGAGQTLTGMEWVRKALEAAGYRCECNGEPGTAGEFIVEIFERTGP